MSSLFSPKDVTVTKFPLIVRTNVFKSNSSLPIVDGIYMFTMTRNILASLLHQLEVQILHHIHITYRIIANAVYANYLDLKIMYRPVCRSGIANKR